MLLDFGAFRKLVAGFSECSGGAVSLDFETTGLDPYHGARAFLIGVTGADGKDFCYFFTGEQGEREAVSQLVSNPRLTYCAHGAQFEQSFLKVQFGTEIVGPIWDSEVMARVQKNNHLSYSLQKCAERVGLSKYPPMLEWLTKKGAKNDYRLAGPELLIPYVERDAWLSWRLRQLQIETFKHWDVSSQVPIKPVVELELAMTKTLFRMSHAGLSVDVNYCKEALAYEESQIEAAKSEFKALTGSPFVDSRQTLEPIFRHHGLTYGQTEKGNASFTEENLGASRGHPIAQCLLRHRQARKRASSYWTNFIALATDGSLIHPRINQNRAVTGRMSISDPSAQNWSDDDETVAYPIRRAFVARPACVIASLDYSSMELRLICDEAGDHGMISRILAGVDFHQETANLAGVSRSLAKNGRFAKTYGAGVKKIAETLGVSRETAQKVSDAIDETSPRVAAYSAELIRYAEIHHQGYTFLGRRFFFDRGFEYLFQNYRIQGGGAEVLKLAILKIEDFLYKYASRKTHMLVPIHDEIVLNMAKSDLPLLASIKQIMIEAYAYRHLPMDVNVAVGPNFYDLEAYVC